jgi:hypothetical protein
MKIPTRYRDLCDAMSVAGWLSHIIAGCNANHRHGDGKKHFLARNLLQTRTGQSFVRGEPVPRFDLADGVPARLEFHDEGGWRTPKIFIHRARSLIGANEHGRLLFAYLEDIPADRITIDPTAATLPTAAPSAHPLSAAEGKRLLCLHRRRERKPGLARAKRREVLKQTGRLACAACDGDYEETYGPGAFRVFEVHHLNPFEELKDVETITTLDQLALVCANCHRVLHRTRPPLEIGELRTRLGR